MPEDNNPVAVLAHSNTSDNNDNKQEQANVFGEAPKITHRASRVNPTRQR